MRLKLSNDQIDSLLNSSDEGASLKHKAVRGGALTMGAQGVLFSLNLIKVIVLARLLDPADFGIVAMVMVVYALASIFKDGGLSSATIQAPNISRGQIGFMFWTNVLINLCLCLIFLAIAPLLAKFYQTEQVGPITRVIAVIFILEGMTIQHIALLKRNLRFGSVALINVTNQFVAVTVSICMALAGMGVWSLVWGTIAGVAAMFVMTYSFIPWLPGKPCGLQEVKPMLRFGVHLSGFSIVNYLTRNLDNILIGRVSGDVALGFYTRAYQIVYMPLINLRTPIENVAYPTLCKLMHTPDVFRSYYRKIVFILAFLSMPTMAFCAGFSHEIVLVVFGEKWLPMVDLFCILSVAGFIQPVIGVKGMTLLSSGKSKIYFYLGLWMSVATVIAMSIGILWGAYGVALAYTIVLYLMQVPLFIPVFKHTPIVPSDLLRPVIPVVVASILAVGTGVFVRKLTGLADLPGLIVGGIISVLLFLLLCAAQKHTRENVIYMINLGLEKILKSSKRL